MVECYQKSCRAEATLTVEYGHERPFTHDYCEPHARQELGKHDDAHLLDGTSDPSEVWPGGGD